VELFLSAAKNAIFVPYCQLPSSTTENASNISILTTLQMKMTTAVTVFFKVVETQNWSFHQVMLGLFTKSSGTTSDQSICQLYNKANPHVIRG